MIKIVSWTLALGAMVGCCGGFESEIVGTDWKLVYSMYLLLIGQVVL